LEIMTMNKLVLVEPSELAELLRDAIAEALDGLPKSTASAPALLDRKALAGALSVSIAALDRMREEPSFPELRIGDAPRFELDRVLEWIRARVETPALRIVGAPR
jgi:hypothetical protein